MYPGGPTIPAGGGEWIVKVHYTLFCMNTGQIQYLIDQTTVIK